MSAAYPKSPFFQPRDRTTPEKANGSRFFRTPGGTTRRKKKVAPHDKKLAEHKSTVLGCASNLVNAIVGAGIVGLPFAIQESGFVPGIVLVVSCAILTEKSLRLLIETAKHANVPSYETAAEAAFGSFGFYFVAINMFVMAYGAMLSYLMIVKDTFSSILGIDEKDVLMKRTVLVVVSSLVILPLSCQRDMADLAKTSKMNVCFDLIMVLLVVYLAIQQRDYHWEEENDFESMDDDDDNNNNNNNNTDTIDLWSVKWETIFIGLGVLSFAFVCQHSAFIIAGSLEKPTKERWSFVTKLALAFAACMSLLMGVFGYLGFGGPQGNLHGNILNSLPENSQLAKVAKGLVGITMLFVYPMESFVARHVCVVLLFEGRKAHEGDDASVLNRRDRRITLTVVLYLSAVIPAALWDQLGDVLAVTGAVGGSCLSYIGPGILYLGIHGGRFLELSKTYFGQELVSTVENDDDEEEKLALLGSHNNNESESTIQDEKDYLACNYLKTLLWYFVGMPIWTKLASVGKGSLTTYVTEMALKSPHPIRIGNVRFARAKVLGGDSFTRVVMLQNNNKNNSTKKNLSAAFDNADTSNSEDSEETPTGNNFRRFSSVNTKLLRADSLPRVSHDSFKMQTTKDGTIVALPPLAFYQPNGKNVIKNNNGKQDYQSINQKIGAMAAAAAKSTDGEDIAIEDDPQGDPPNISDFVMAISYVILGIIAMFAGLASIFL